MVWNKLIPQDEITNKVTEASVEFAKEFGEYLGVTSSHNDNEQKKVTEEKLTTSQLRKFFGEVKRQQLNGYDETDFVLLKPKLAYAVGRAKRNAKINDFYLVIANAIDQVKSNSQEESEKRFKNFIKIFEAIVAYHKAAEGSK